MTCTACCIVTPAALLLQIELDEHLSRILPSNLTRFFYCNSGSEAVENAVKIARAATGRQDIIAFDVRLDLIQTAVDCPCSVVGRWRVPNPQPTNLGGQRTHASVQAVS